MIYLSVGKNGARVNLGKKGVKTTAGLPGTGLSYSKFSSCRNKVEQTTNERNNSSIGFRVLFLYLIFLHNYLGQRNDEEYLSFGSYASLN
ncbi:MULTISPECIES: DUF4236 domain-containing protein [Acinetobacter]|uniref:DUF4236 domain-containing protein n=1 Tax=Acinetobacter TaxID=469 RepID=UPI003898FCF2